MIFMPVKHKKYEKYYDVEASKQKEYKYLMKVCTQIITGIVNYVQFITEQIIVLFLWKWKSDDANLVLILKPQNQKKLGFQARSYSKDIIPACFYDPLLCAISWTQVFAQMTDLELDVQITEQIVVFTFSNRQMWKIQL